MLILGSIWDATGAAAAVLISTVRLRRSRGWSRSSGCTARTGGRTEAVAVVKVVIVSGIWPPDVGGPASHAPELADFLHGRGHEVRVVTTADAPPGPAALPGRLDAAALPAGCAPLPRGGARAPGGAGADVVYSTGMLGRSALGSRSRACRSSFSSRATRPTSARCGAG